MSDETKQKCKENEKSMGQYSGKCNFAKTSNVARFW